MDTYLKKKRISRCIRGVVLRKKSEDESFIITIEGDDLEIEVPNEWDISIGDKISFFGSFDNKLKMYKAKAYKNKTTLSKGKKSKRYIPAEVFLIILEAIGAIFS